MSDKLYEAAFPMRRMFWHCRWKISIEHPSGTETRLDSKRSNGEMILCRRSYLSETGFASGSPSTAVMPVMTGRPFW